MTSVQPGLLQRWKGHFYPEKLPQKEMLQYYSGRFSTVEINNTFHKFPGTVLTVR